MKTLILKIVLLLNVNLDSSYFHSLLQFYGIKSKVTVVNLAEPLLLGNQLNYFNKLELAFSGKSPYTHILTGPFMQGKSEFLLGLTRNNFSMSVWNEQNDLNQPRIVHSQVAFIHEIGHSYYRLKHTTGCTTVMDEAAMACPNVADLRFTSAQKLKIKFITKRKK